MKRMMNRRQVLAAATAMTALATLPRFSWASMTIGSKTVTTLSDGNLMLPVSFLFPDVPQDELQALLAPGGAPVEMFEPPCNLTLVEDGERKILFDAGSGPNFMPSAGTLFDAMSTAGIEPDAITDVIFTHGHPDHLWGILDDFDEVAFPSAQLHFPQVEWDFWYDPGTVDIMDEARKSFAVGAKNRLEAIEEQVNLFAWGDEVAPGIEAMDTSGHTPGHTSFLVHGANGEGLIILGDAVTNTAVSFARPDWPTGSDQDPAKGVETRMKLLDRLATDKFALSGFHLAEGGMGRVERDGTAYRFVADA